MDNEIKLDEPLAPETVTAMREMYAPPQGDGYWSSLEARVMSRVRESAATNWWLVLGTRARGGLVAAAAAIVAAVVGLLLIQAHNQEMRMAYESATRPPAAESIAVPSGALSELDGPDARGATFRDIISH